MKHLFISIIVILFLSGGLNANAKLKVACVGNSITENTALAGSDKYPAILQSLLGTDNYEVKNYGASGCTLLKKGNSPYWNQSKYTDVKNWNPDIVIIKLGTNDAKPGNWIYKDEFVSDYVAFVNTFKNLASHPIIFVCYPIPAFPGNGLPVNDNTITDEMIPMINVVATQTGATVIDLHTPMLGHEDFTMDRIHPNVKGTTLMAYTIYPYLCSTCPEKKLPDGFWSKPTSFDHTDKAIAMTSSFSQGNDLVLLTDNDLSTTLSVSYTANSWVAIELPELFRVTGYTVTAANSGNANSPRSWKLQGSATGTTWMDMDTRSAQVFYDGETKVMEIPYTSIAGLKSLRYYRLLFLENNGGENLALSEWQLFGNPTSFQSAFTNNGGLISGRYTGYSGEGIGNLIDGTISTKYCVITSKIGWMQYDSPRVGIVDRYTITSCYSNYDRNLKKWQLLGSNDGTQWTVLDERSNQDFMVKYSTMEYDVQSPGEYSKYRLNVLENNGASAFQLSQWQLFEKKTSAIPAAISENDWIVSLHPEGNELLIHTNRKIDSVEMINTSGKTVKLFSEENKSYSLSDLRQGLYLVKVKTGKDTLIKKIIYQK